MTSEQGLGPDWEQWARQLSESRPGAIVPMPAAGRRDLRGRRVIMGLPGLGWRADLRGDDPVVQGSRTFIPVLPEQEWYRAEAEQIEVFAPLVPAERVWLETIEPSAVDHAPGLVSLDAPPRREPIAARDAVRITARRLVRFTEDGEQRDLRAVTEPFASADGIVCVRIARELDWYRWAWSGQVPKTLEVPLDLLWTE